MTRRVLMVAYHFPPLGGVGVQRTLKFVEHLPQAGWQPVVVAPRGSAYRSMDPGLLERLDPGTAVHRALVIEPANIRAFARRLLAARSPAPRRTGLPSAKPTRQEGAHASLPAIPRRTLNAAWRLWVRSLFVPDEEMLWIPAAAYVGVKAHRRSPVEVIYSSSPPPSGHLAAGIVKSLTGRPWVADFRDPWTGSWSAARRTGVHEAMERWFERWVIRHADRVVFATKGLRNLYAARYPARASRFVAIPNGYDRGDAGPAPPPARNPGRPYHLVHAGSIYSVAELADFLAGVARALDVRPQLRDRLRIDFYGWITPEASHLLSELSGPMAEICRAHGFVPRETILAELRGADGTLVLMGSEPGRELAVPAKLYEYIGLDRPVLAMVARGEARQILEDLGWGEVIEPDVESVAAGLLRMVDASPPARQADPEGRYDRRVLAARLGAILDEATAAAPSSPASAGPEGGQRIA